MPVAQNHRQVNRELQRLGLGHLKDPNLIANMAFLVRDHDHFRGILMHMPMPDRKEAYDCLAPKLRFKAKPLEDYEIESRRIAEEKQLPHYDPATLGATEWKPQEIETQEHRLSRFDEPAQSSLAKVAERAISTDLREQNATQQLRLTCRMCTYEQVFRVKRRSSAYKLARQDGWQVDKHTALCRSCKPKPAIN